MSASANKWEVQPSRDRAGAGAGAGQWSLAKDQATKEGACWRMVQLGVRGWCWHWRFVGFSSLWSGTRSGAGNASRCPFKSEMCARWWRRCTLHVHVCVATSSAAIGAEMRTHLGTNSIVVVAVQLETKTQPCAAFTCQFVFGQRLNNELIFATFARLLCVAHAAHVMLHYVGARLPQSESFVRSSQFPLVHLP